MKKTVLILAVSILMIAGSVFAGDLDVTGKLTVGESISVAKTNFNGLYFGDTYKGFVWRLYGGGTPAITSNILAVGTDDSITEIMWDTFRDGGWAFCEGVTGVGASVKCTDYAGLMTADDYYWVWKHGTDTRYPTTADLKFIFDGESNDGVMGFMEDEDAFFFDEKLGIGTRTPQSKLAVSGLPTSPPVAGTSNIVCIDPDGNLWVDDDGTNDCQ